MEHLVAGTAGSILRRGDAADAVFEAEVDRGPTHRDGGGGMSAWGGGYVTDIPYTTGWYRQQSPSIMALACLLGGVAAPMPAADDAVSYLELGCGHGFGAMLLAASNPAWRVTAVDFNPAHIAAAREWAAEAGLTNITFLEADLTTLAEDAAAQAIPQADFVSMHGVWTWVPARGAAGHRQAAARQGAAGRRGACQLQRAAGVGQCVGHGAACCAWSGGSTAGAATARRSEGFKFVREMIAAEAVQLTRSEIVKVLLEKLDGVARHLPGA